MCCTSFGCTRVNFDTFWTLDLMLLFLLSCSFVCHTRVAMSASCIFGLVSLFFVRVLYFYLCCMLLLSVEEDFFIELRYTQCKEEEFSLSSS